MKDNTTPAISSSKRLWIALILGSLSAFGPLSVDMYLPALPDIAKDLHTDQSLVQLSLTFFLFGLSFGQLLAGPLSDIKGRRPILLYGLTIYFAVSLICAFSQSIWFLIPLRLFQGLSGAAGIVISRAVVRDLYSGKELTKFFSMLALVQGLGPILAPIIGGQLLRFAPWQGVFIVLTTVGFIMFFIVFFGLPETLPPHSRSHGGFKNTFVTFQKLVLDRSFMGFAIAQGLVTAAMFAYISGSPFVIQSIFGASPQMFSMIFAINGVGIMIASQLTGRLTWKFSERKMFVFGLGMSAFGSVLLLLMVMLHGGLFTILPFLFLVVSSVGVVNTTGFTLALQNHGKSAGSASALLGVLSLTFGGIAAPLVGIGGGGTAIPMGIVITCSGLGALITYFLLVYQKQNKRDTKNL